MPVAGTVNARSILTLTGILRDLEHLHIMRILFRFNFTIYATVLIKKAFVGNYFTPGDPWKRIRFRVVVVHVS